MASSKDYNFDEEIVQFKTFNSAIFNHVNGREIVSYHIPHRRCANHVVHRSPTLFDIYLGNIMQESLGYFTNTIKING